MCCQNTVFKLGGLNQCGLLLFILPSLENYRSTSRRHQTPACRARRPDVCGWRPSWWCRCKRHSSEQKGHTATGRRGNHAQQNQNKGECFSASSFIVQKKKKKTHQAKKHQWYLDDIGVRDWIETSERGVDDRHRSGDPDADAEGQIQNHTHGRSWITVKHKVWQRMWTMGSEMCGFQCTCTSVPKEISNPGIQITSVKTGMMARTAVSFLPYFFWNGSIMLT